MNTVHSLTFVVTTWSIVTSIVVLIATIMLCLIAWRRSGYRKSYGALELFRFAIVCFVVLLLNQPEWIEEFRPTEKPAIAVLMDETASMQTRDVATTGDDSTSVITRNDAVRPLKGEPFWSSVQKQFSIVVQPFGQDEASKTTVAGTNLYDPLMQATRGIKNLRAIVLASDGDWNSGESPVQAATALRLKNIPVMAIPVGSRSRLPDIELLSLDLPSFGIVGKSVRIPFTIESSLPRDTTATVKLETADGDQVTKEILIAAMGRTSESLNWKPIKTGQFTLKLQVPNHPDELIVDNNQLTAPISIREEKLKVLVVESIPRWEYRYLRNALSRDPGVEVACLLFHPGLEKSGGGNKDYIKQFPQGLDELSQFDVVFLGDVGIDEGQLTTEDCRLLKGLVEHQASGLVFIPGWQGRQNSLAESPLTDLYPVVLDLSQPDGWGSRTPSHFELTELGRRSLLTKLADTQEDNMDVWEGLPGFQWYSAVIRAKAGSDVLAVHKDVSNDFGRVPLLAARTFGAGKVLFMGTDGAWRWRKGVEDKYHYRFWGQVVRWMAYQRNMSKGDSMRMYYSPEQPQVRQTIALNANVMEKNGEPLPKGNVTAKIVSPAGKLETIRFTSTGDEWGAFSSKFIPQEAGQYKVTLSCQQTAANLETTIFVQGNAVERIGRPARFEVMEEIARVTQGKTISLDRIEQILKSLTDLPTPPPAIKRIPLWAHLVTATMLIVLLGLFWIGRKMAGLI